MTDPGARVLFAWHTFAEAARAGDQASVTRRVSKLVNVAQTFQETAAARPHYPALRTHGGEIDWTWADYRRLVGECAAGLAGLGCARGDTLACWLTNRPEFHVADIAAGISRSLRSRCTQAPRLGRPGAIAVAGCHILVTEKVLLDRALDVRASGSTALRTIVCLGRRR
jgi:long-chain acyl-CoA synthetase